MESKEVENGMRERLRMGERRKREREKERILDGKKASLKH